MCGICGILAEKNAIAADLIDALTVLQHRGQDAAGIATFDEKNFHLKKGAGLVRDIFFEKHLRRLVGKVGIAHVRYPTAGANSTDEAQPFFVNSPFGIALAHNGNLINAENLARELFRDELRHLNTGSDSEVLLNVLASEIAKLKKIKLSPDDVFAAVKNLMRRAKGSFAAVAIIAGVGLVAFRDSRAFRPLSIGTRGNDFAFASENIAFEALGFKFLRDVAAGECVLIDTAGKMHSQILQNKTRAACIFEFVYLARPDAMIDQISVHKARIRMGEKLAQKIQKNLKSKIDVVIPIPETSRVCAVEVAKILGVPFREGFVKNRYVGRTFIMPHQNARQKSIRQKLSPVELEFRDKNVLLVDDSIVRGNTSRQIVELARECRAKKIFFASAAPPIIAPCVFGVDMPSRRDFIADQNDEKKIAKIIGADQIFYQNLNDLIDAVRGKQIEQKFCTACFDEKYPEKIDAQFFAKNEKKRSEN